MLDKGDLDGAAVWRRIVTAINELLADAPAGDASRHRRCRRHNTQPFGW